jgi:hypothetical protein
MGWGMSIPLVLAVFTRKHLAWRPVRSGPNPGIPSPCLGSFLALRARPCLLRVWPDASLPPPNSAIPGSADRGLTVLERSLSEASARGLMRMFYTDGSLAQRA